MNNDPFGRRPDEMEDEARHSYAEGAVFLRTIADDFREIAVKGATISRGRLGLLHDRLSAVSRITAVPAGEPVTGPANPDIIDHLFDATEGIDAPHTVEYDEEGQR
jgi:hypothetical protein